MYTPTLYFIIESIIIIASDKKTRIEALVHPEGRQGPKHIYLAYNQS